MTEKLKKERSQLRRIVSRHCQKEVLTEVDFDFLKEKVELLNILDTSIHDVMLTSDIDETILNQDYDECEVYQKKWLEVKIKFLNNTEELKPTENKTRHNLRLPKLEIRKFDDNPKSWLGFWGQFRKIHEDGNIDEEDKFQYLVQAMSEGSCARNLVESYPPTKENYKKVIETLKSRFAKDEVLIEIYVRELLALITCKNNTKIDILYDKIIVNLEILESLGIIQNKFECILLPLIESSLPDDILISWTKMPRNNESKLCQLLAFLKNEVEAQHRCSLARNFGEFDVQSTSTPTASCLVAETSKTKAYVENISCLFCEKSHNTLECGKSNSLSLEQKTELIKKKGGCYICLKKGHLAKFCKSFVKCMCCGKRHIVVLCPKLHEEKSSNWKPKLKSEEPKMKSEEAELANNFSCNNFTTLLQTLVVKVSGKREKKVRALLDSGSQRTYIKTGLAEEIGLPEIGKESLSHVVFGGIKQLPKVHKVLEFRVSSIDDSFHTKMVAIEQDVLCGNLPKVTNTDLIKKLQMNQIALTDTKEDIADISILIGSDYLGSIILTNYIHLNENLVAIPTKLGWTLQGPIQGIYNTSVSSNFVATIQEDSLTHLWDLETLGIKDHCDEESEDVLAKFNETIRENIDGRYEVELLWTDCPRVQACYEQAYKRLWSTTRKLEKMKKIKEYAEVFQEWVNEGIIEKVEKCDKQEGHYLPHHPVIKMQSATTKIRPVFDASAVDSNKISLNTCIEKGPNLMEVIPKLLIQFRAGAFGVTSDIRKAFLQIAVYPIDRMYLKFLWWSNLHTKNEIVTYQHARVPFGVACSPFLLAATISHHLQKVSVRYPETAKILKDSFYVDNCVTSFDTEQEVMKFEEESKALMREGKFDLRGWMTNSKEEVEPVSVLGIQWNRNEDSIVCNTNFGQLPHKTTKRNLLSIAQNIFDPLGLLSPVLLIPKLILQKTWKSGTGWDETIPEEQEKEYKDWIHQISYINQCKIPRRLSIAKLADCKTSIHVFCDASKDAYSGCVFLRTEHKDGVTVQLIIAKSRETPIKRALTLPRLELMGALIASRLFKEVISSGLTSKLKDYTVVCWTDSAVVIAWLKRQETWKTFVSNRVKEICRNTNKADWRHLPGVFNPADLPSRGCNAKTLLKTHWWTGPEWLYLNENFWPKSTFHENEDENAITNEKMKDIFVLVNETTDKFSEQLLKFNQYSKIVKLVARLLRMNPQIKRKYNVISKHIRYEEYSNAEETLLKLVQRETFFKKGDENKNLFTFEENGIIKVKTRLDFSNEDKNFVHPILLPGTHEIVRRMVHEKHRELKHSGTQIMMTTLRNKFWVTGIRKLSKKVVTDCVICKRYKTKHFTMPQPPLPADRICTKAIFEVTGIDLAGPLILRGGRKCWIVLFTCAVYRAIHLELTNSLSTVDFMMALRRFIARRGRPRIIYTDNGTNFVGTANLLKNLNWQEIEEASNTYEIIWKFSVPAAPWWGGWWERIVRTVKEMLRRILGKASIGWIELTTILCDCETTINNRPLTYVDMEGLRPLTPMMFLQSLPNSDTYDFDQIDHQQLNVRYKYLQKLREEFKMRFKNEYIGLIKGKRGINVKEPKVGDVVLIETDGKRLDWPLGIILESYAGKDGYSRAAKVKTMSGERIRAYQKLYPLEISASEEWLTQQKIPTSRIGRHIKLPARFYD